MNTEKADIDNKTFLNKAYSYQSSKSHAYKSQAFSNRNDSKKIVINRSSRSSTNRLSTSNKLSDRNSTRSTAKVFVFDTNIVLHDPHAIHYFQENDIYIPLTVIEELDNFKKGNDILSYNARQFMREMDKISDESLFDKGVSLGKDKGHIKVEVGHPYTQVAKDSLSDDIPDHRIIACAIWLRDQMPDRKVILVTKDLNMRIKARALGLLSQDYLRDHIDEKRIEKSTREVMTLRRPNKASLQLILDNPNGVEISKLGISRKPASNQLYKVPYNKETFLARYIRKENKIVRVMPHISFGITPRNREQTFALDAILNPNISIVSLTGRAGTGKTLLALAGALAQADHFNQILLSRPVIPLKNQDLGFLPGNTKEKIGPFMLPLFDNLDVIKNSFSSSSPEVVKIEDMLKREKLLINPLAYIRGRSLSNVFFIIDEAQNLTPHEVKTIITRAGEGTKIVFTGDIFQIDQPYLDMHSNGLSHLNEGFSGQDIFEHVNMMKGERSHLSELASKLL
ncbi:MAG: PhoH family protein [Bacteroidales bacterium]